MASKTVTRSIECFHSRGQHLCRFIGTKESVCIRKEFNSHRIGLGQNHGRRFIVLGHQYGHHDIMWKHSITSFTHGQKCSCRRLILSTEILASNKSTFCRSVSLAFSFVLAPVELLSNRKFHHVDKDRSTNYYNLSGGGDFCRHSSKAWKGCPNPCSSCHPLQQTTGNCFNA